MTRYSPSRNYRIAGLVALVFAGFSAWFAWNWPMAWVPAALFLASGALILALAFQPAIEIHESHLGVGKRAVPWSEVRRLDRTGWISPLVVHITLSNDRRFLLIYPGDLDSSNSLLRQLRRMAREALIDGVPYRQFWGENVTTAERRPLPSPRYPLLRPEDEAEVERLYQRLKTVGHLDPKNSTDEK
jgi:hypothetical protein